MENILFSNSKAVNLEEPIITMINSNLNSADILKEYTITSINTDSEEMEDFLFTLGCYKGEKITVISKVSNSLVVSIKDARYSIDKELASCIIVSA